MVAPAKPGPVPVQSAMLPSTRLAVGRCGLTVMALPPPAGVAASTPGGAWAFAVPAALTAAMTAIDPARRPLPMPGVRFSQAPAARALAQLRALPLGGEAPLQLVAQLGDRYARLLERVAVAQRDCVVLHRLMVDGHAPRGADLVLAAVALADRAALVEFGRHALAQVEVDLSRALGLAVLVHEREHRDLHRREPRGQPQDHAPG